MEYGKGNILGMATTLPATSALGILLSNNTNPALLTGYFIISSVCLLLLLAQTSRLIINLLRETKDKKN